MALTVTFVSGPRHAGKSTVIQAMLGDLYKRPPHYLRLAKIAGDKKPPLTMGRPPVDVEVGSARWLNYDEDSIFEVLPEALTRIHRKDRYGAVIIEADADPHLRHAHPYDRRIFVMPAPRSLHEVFRSVREAATALQGVLDDTAAFAREIYGMIDSSLTDDEEHERRAPFTARQLRGFLDSPLGNELATRIQFQPEYHGLVESDVVLINTGVGGLSPVVDECGRRLERLLARLRGGAARKNTLFCCDPVDPHDPLRKKLIKALKDLHRDDDR
ncbi:MAG TPA: hypothetical protein VM243_06620 [Phycisphaerae bacterium]|nr:hypothetical protein [Phycisphaerae bacterium]